MNFDVNKEIYIQELESTIITLTKDRLVYKSAFLQLLQERESLLNELAKERAAKEDSEEKNIDKE